MGGCVYLCIYVNCKGMMLCVGSVEDDVVCVCVCV